MNFLSAHDISLGRLNVEDHTSLFFPGKPLQFSSKQEALRDLPVEMQGALRAIAKATLKELSRQYRVQPSEAGIIRFWARRVVAVGLSRAIAESRSIGRRGQKLYEDRLSTHFARRLEPVPFEQDLREFFSARRGDGPGDLMVGGFLTYPPGSYRASFRLRAGEPLGRIASLQVYEAKSGRVIAERELVADDLPPDRWSKITLPFELPAADNRVVFRVAWHGQTDLDFFQVQVD